MENNNEKQELFICACHKVEHQMVMRWWDDEDNEELVYCEIHLNKLPFFKRLIHGIKYIFGYTSATGDFEEFIFKQEDAYRLQKMVTFLKRKHNGKNK